MQYCSPTNKTLTSLYMLVRSIKCNVYHRRKCNRCPITLPLLKTIHTFLTKSTYCHTDKLMIWAAVTTAYFAFLRSSEYTSSHINKFDPATTLCFHNITKNAPFFIINIKASKTDPFRQGCNIKLAPSRSQICPVAALSAFIISHPTKTGPMFTYADGTYLTRRRLNNLLRTIFPKKPNEPISTHSLRIGAATTAAAAGLPKWLIQQLGRWNSDCFRTYIRIPNQTINAVSHLLANTLDHTNQFDPDLA